MPKNGESSRLRSFLFQNHGTAQTIAKNTFWLSFGEIIGRLLRISIIFYGARVLGAAGWGVWSYMVSLSAILVLFADMGLSNMLIREGAKSEELRKIYFSTGFALKTILTLISFAIVVFVAPNVTSLTLPPMLIYAVAFLMTFDTLRVFGHSIFRAQEKMQIEAATNIITQIIIVIGGFYVLFNYPSPENLALAYAFGSGIGLLVVAFLVRKYIAGIFKNFRRDLLKTILVNSWPLGFATIFGVLLVNIDTVMIGWFLSAEHVGYYSAAQKPIAFLYILPSFIVGGLFPVLARYAKDNTERFRAVMERGLSLVMLIAYPITIGVFLTSERIVNLIYGAEFLLASESLRILSLTLLITFPATIIVHSIFAYNRQKEMVPAWIIGSLANVGLNFYLIPVFGIVGAAWTSLATQVAINGYFWVRMKKINYFTTSKDLRSILRAVLVMAIAIVLMGISGFKFTLILILSPIIYLASLIFFKDPTVFELWGVMKKRYDPQHPEA